MVGSHDPASPTSCITMLSDNIVVVAAELCGMRHPALQAIMKGCESGKGTVFYSM